MNFQLFSNFFLFQLYFLDSPSTSYDFQDPATAVMKGIINLHDSVFLYLVGVVLFVSWLLYRTIIFYNFNNLELVKIINHINQSIQVRHGTVIEIIWRLVPVFVLLLIIKSIILKKFRSPSKSTVLKNQKFQSKMLLSVY